MQTKGLEFFYMSVLKDFGLTEDGEKFLGEVYLVIAEDADGNRWVHNSRFSGLEKLENEWGTGFNDIRQQAIAACERLIERIKKADTLSMVFWDQTRPAYGSQAYQDYGMADELSLEKVEG